MRENTEEYILQLIDNYRDVLVAKVEKCLCLDCYNMVKSLNLTEKDVELRYDKCNLCSKQKPCIKQ